MAFSGCPFCVRVREAAASLEIDLELRDIQTDAQHRAELVSATGRQMVPCLRIQDGNDDDRWMHESGDIIGYLEEPFA